MLSLDFISFLPSSFFLFFFGMCVSCILFSTSSCLLFCISPFTPSSPTPSSFPAPLSCFVSAIYVSYMFRFFFFQNVKNIKKISSKLVWVYGLSTLFGLFNAKISCFLFYWGGCFLSNIVSSNNNHLKKNYSFKEPIKKLKLHIVKVFQVF